jgi:ribose transport system permease protein
MDANDTIHVCVSGMGLYAVGRDRTVKKLSDEVPRSLFSIRDDSRIRFAHDLDIAPDGLVFFSETTARFDTHDWAADSLEMRGNGRLLVCDPRSGKTEVVLRDLIFPNGVCVETNGLSLLVAETWPCRVSRYWFDGPRKGQLERVVENLPGFAANINRSSDGNYWLAFLGVRTPLHDLAMQMPGFRKRMAQRVASDEWLYPNFNAGLLVKFSESGEILECLWDGGQRHATLTSVCEHRGYLYLGGIFNNRIGRIRLPDANPNWTMNQSYWGPMPYWGPMRCS